MADSIKRITRPSNLSESSNIWINGDIINAARLNDICTTINQIAGNVENINNNVKIQLVSSENNPELIFGNLVRSSGNYSQAENRICTETFINQDENYAKITCNEGYWISIYGWKAGVYLGRWYIDKWDLKTTSVQVWQTSFDLMPIWLGTEATKIKLCIAKGDRYKRDGIFGALDPNASPKVLNEPLLEMKYYKFTEIFPSFGHLSILQEQILQNMDDRQTQIDWICQPEKNLFENITFQVNSNINNNTGIYQSWGNNTTAHQKFISIVPNHTYTFNADSDVNTYFFWYDSNKNFIKYFAKKISPPQKATAPENAQYLRMKLNKPSTPEESTSEESTSEEPTSQMLAERGNYYLQDITHLPNNLADESIQTKHIANKAITREKTAYLHATKNIFTGTLKSYSNINNKTGVYSESPNSKVTAACADFIPVEPEQTYTYSDVKPDFLWRDVHWFQYDKDKQLITPAVPAPDTKCIIGTTIVTEQNAAYIRIKLHQRNNTNTYQYTEELASIPYIQIEKGAEKTSYTPPLLLDEDLYMRGDADITYRFQALSDANVKESAIRTALMNDLLEAAGRTAETVYRELLVGTKAIINRYRAKKHDIIEFAVISDCHYGGTRTNTATCELNIAALCELAKQMKPDFVMNCGDMITNYFDSSSMNNLQHARVAEKHVYDLFQPLITSESIIPYYICKGNHDIGVAKIVEVEKENLVWSDDKRYYYYDEDSGTFYKIQTADVFNSYLEDNEKSIYENKAGQDDLVLFPNDQIQQLCLHGIDLTQQQQQQQQQQQSYSPYCPDATFNDNDQFGWYYYFDVKHDNVTKLRCIVLNDYYNNDGTIGRSPAEGAWMESRLNQALREKYPVLTFSHTANGPISNNIKPKIDAFMENGGTYIGHIHGHEHLDVYSNPGFNNIGIRDGMSNIKSHENNTCKPSGYGFDYFELDLTDKLLIEIRTGATKEYTKNDDGTFTNKYRTEDRIFSYGQKSALLS